MVVWIGGGMVVVKVVMVVVDLTFTQHRRSLTAASQTLIGEMKYLW